MQEQTLEKSVQEWVSLDNQIKLLTEKTKQLRERREQVGGQISSSLEERNKQHMPIQISDGRLRMTKTRIAQPLTFQYLQKSLNQMINNETKVSQIIDYVKKNREIKEVVEIRRYTNDTR
jgi:hypothetical protein